MSHTGLYNHSPKTKCCRLVNTHFYNLSEKNITKMNAVNAYNAACLVKTTLFISLPVHGCSYTTSTMVWIRQWASYCCRSIRSRD